MTGKNAVFLRNNTKSAHVKLCICNFLNDLCQPGKENLWSCEATSQEVLTINIDL